MFAGAGDYTSAQTFTDGFAPALGVATGLSLAGAFAGAALARPGPALHAGPVPALTGEGGS